jgi:hypothetical protein
VGNEEKENFIKMSLSPKCKNVLYCILAIFYIENILNV